MTNEEIYEILKEIKKDLSEAIKTKADKDSVATLWKVLFSLFGVNIFGVISLVIVFFNMTGAKP